MTDNYKKIINVITAAKRPAFFCHTRPDGDTLGAAFALKHVLKAEADIFCETEVTPYYDIIPGIKDLKRGEFDAGAYDLLVSVDCADAQRIGRYAAAFLKHPNTVNIDHHQTGEPFAKLNYVRPQASSSGELVFNLIKDAGLELNEDCAVCLYIAVCTDTGNFTHSNTTPETYNMAAGLLRFKIDVSYINLKLYKEMPEGRVKLLARALGSLKMYADGKIALLYIGLKDFAECGCKSCDNEGFVEYAANVEGALVGVLLTEIARNSYKISLRSKAGIDISRPAMTFNGGGHKQAAGCIVSGNLIDVTEKIVFECSKEL